jgi:hypothetical protein
VCRQRPGCGLGADAERQIDAVPLDQFRRLRQHLDAGAADALHQVRRVVTRHAGVEADMPGHHVSVEGGLGHGTGDRGSDVDRIDRGLGDHGASGLDAKVDR